MHYFAEPPLPPPKRFRSEISPQPADLPYGSTHQLSPVLDSSSSAFLVDRMFAHLSRETEVMREWVNLERERLAHEIAHRKEEKEREERRERSFLEVLTKLQDQVFTFLSQHQALNRPFALANEDDDHNRTSDNSNSKQTDLSTSKP